MKSEETIYNKQNANESEETMVNEQKNTASEAPVENKKTGKKADWKQVTIGTATGIFFGTLFTSFTNVPGQEEEKTDEPHHHGEETPVPDVDVTVDGLPVAHNVTDDMSFNEAFAAARAEVGAGGVFSWHGGVYGTYYADEWNSMSAEERAEFGARVHYGTGVGSSTGGEVDSRPEPQPTPDPIPDPEPTPSEEEVTVLGIEHGTWDDGSPVTTVSVMADGEQAILIDADGNGSIDVLAMDVNNDGQITSDELMDVSDMGLTVEHYQQQLDNQNLMAENLPDYTNDANVGDFA